METEIEKKQRIERKKGMPSTFDKTLLIHDLFFYLHSNWCI